MIRNAISALFAIGVVTGANAVTFQFPTTGNDLDHYNYYFWGVNWTLPSDQVVTGARLTFHNIYDWVVEDDVLHVDLINSATDVGVQAQFTSAQWATYLNTLNNAGGASIARGDDQNPSDQLGPFGLNLVNWTDPQGGSPTGFDLVVDIPSTHLDWLADGSLGIGIDPDCHYYAGGVDLTITTVQRPPSVPDGGTTAMLLGFALLGVEAVRRRITV